MKKLYLVFVTLLLLVLGFWVGRYLYKLTTIDTELLSRDNEEVNIQLKEYNSKLYSTEANTKDKKLLPTAVFIFKTTYEKCGHTLNEYRKISQNEINLTEEEIHELYSDWTINSFTEKEVIFTRMLNESCKQHFVIRELNGKLAVYIINENNVEELKYKTNIETKYLTQVDIEKVRLGIRVNGMEQLNAKLEDFE